MASLRCTTLGIFIIATALHSIMGEDIKVPTVTDFFQITNKNLTSIKWAHAVNSKKLLQEAIEDKDVQMIEADVILSNGVPIFAHPPANESDLNLEQALDELKKNATSKKGLKLDFKQTDAINPSVTILKKHINATWSIPIWLNADIMSGSEPNSPAGIDGPVLFKSGMHISGAVLSIGWTTQYPNGTNYNKTHVEAMRNLVATNNVTMERTYPIRAVLAANDDSIAAFGDLDKAKESITIWSADNKMETDQVIANVGKLNELIKNVGVANVYIDVPTAVMEKIELPKSGVANHLPMSSVLLSIILAALYGKMW